MGASASGSRYDPSFSDEQRLDRINNIRGQLPHLEEGPDKARLMGELAHCVPAGLRAPTGWKLLGEVARERLCDSDRDSCVRHECR